MNQLQVLVLMTFCLVVGGKWFSSPTKLSLVDSGSGHNFGSNVAIYDTYLVVGSNTGDVNDVANAGSVAIFARDGTSWRKVMKLTTPNGQEGYNFGRDIDIHESTIIIGSSKAAFVFQRNNTMWQLLSALSESECATSVTVYSSYCAVGCASTNKVNIYKQTSMSTWNHLHALTPNEVSTSGFGCAVAMYDEYLAVASLNAVHVYKRNNRIWDPQLTIKGNNVCKLSMHEDRIAFVSNSDQNSVYIYKRTYDSWGLEGHINLTIASLSISLYQEHLLVGSTDLVETNLGSARALVYSLRDGEWSLDTNLTTSNVRKGDKFGMSVAAWYNSLLLVGAPNNDVDRGTYGGSVYVFENRLNVQPIKSFEVKCTDTDVTLSWDKSLFNADTIRVILLDPSCNTHFSSSTHVWVQRGLDECGANITTMGDFITYSNIANVYVTQRVRSEVLMENLFTYSVKCTMRRTSLAGSSNNADIQKTQEVEVPTTGEPIVVRMSLAVYSSAEYQSLAPIPYKITTDSTVFIGINRIKGVGNESEYAANYKFIAHTCYATTSPYANDTDVDYFLADKCILENSFTILQQDNDYFRFQIKASTFIAFRKTVYFHCLIDICRSNAISPQCTQECSGQQSSDSSQIAAENKPVVRITLSSAEMRYNEEVVPTCDGVNCTTNSSCYILQAPVCICDKGYVYSQQELKCIAERILEVRGVHLEMEWTPELANTTSKVFLEVAFIYAEKIYKLLKATESSREIEGVRVISISQGSLIFDVQIIYAKEVQKEEAFKSFVKAITEVPIPTDDGESTAGSTVHKSMGVLKNFIPYLVTDEKKEEKIEEEEKYIWYIPVVVVLLLFFLLCVIIVLFVMIRNRRSNKMLRLN